MQFFFSLCPTDFSGWASAIGTFFSALVALGLAIYFTVCRPKLRAPKFVFYFNPDNKHFRDEGGEIDQQQNKTVMKKINCLLSVKNTGKTTAECAMVCLERIVILEKNGKTCRKEFIYNPSPINWSGKSIGVPINVYPGINYYLDFMLITTDERPGYKPLEWYIWINSPSEISAPSKFDYPAKLLHYFFVAAKNADAQRYIASVELVSPDCRPRITITKNSEKLGDDHSLVPYGCA